jgi:excisionase family DNA binding protein
MSRVVAIPEEERGDPSQVESTPGTEPLWTVAEVAKYLRLAPETVRMMARRGELPSLKVGKRLWRFRSKAIRDWLALQAAE